MSHRSGEDLLCVGVIDEADDGGFRCRGGGRGRRLDWELYGQHCTKQLSDLGTILESIPIDIINLNRKSMQGAMRGTSRTLSCCRCGRCEIKIVGFQWRAWKEHSLLPASQWLLRC
jgi:hypothetical protein